MTTTIISSEGRLLIPEAVRERLNLKVGTELTIDVQGDTLVLKRTAPYDPDWRKMRGMCKGGENLTDALKEERAAELAHDDARINEGR